MRKLLCLLFCAFLLFSTTQGEVTLLPPLTDDEINDMVHVGWTMQQLLQEGWDRFAPELSAEDRFLKSGLFDVVSLVPAQSDWRGLLLDLLTLESAEDYRAVLRKPYAGIIDSMTGDSKEDALAAAERVFQAAGIDKILPYRRFFACPRYAEMQTVWTVITAFNELLRGYRHAGLLPVYDAGFISMENQFLTVGINGFVEAAEFLDMQISPHDAAYHNFAQEVLQPIYEANKAARTKELMFSEFVPAESLGAKNAAWDRADGYVVPRSVYNSYFYRVEDAECNVLDKLLLHGRAFTRYLDGGSALHINLEEHLDKAQ